MREKKIIFSPSTLFILAMNFCLKCLQKAGDLSLRGEQSEIVTLRRRLTVECWLGFLNAGRQRDTTTTGPCSCTPLIGDSSESEEYSSSY